jgi:hypothetical protein
MSVPLHLHAQFEDAVHQAFPLYPLPRLDDWLPHTWLERSARPLFVNKTWPEIVGVRMVSGELDGGLLSWMASVPGHVVAYFVPSHLIQASLLLSYGAGRNHVDGLVEAFILPFPGMDDVAAQEIDAELGLDAGVADYADRRLRLHARLTTAQRTVVGRLLDLHLMHVGASYGSRGRALLAQNRDAWLAAS